MAFDFNLVPDWWAVCLHTDCPQADSCLRFEAGQSVPSTVTVWPGVVHGARHDGTCACYVKNEKVRVARGFNNMFARVKSRDDIYAMRRELTDYLGSVGTFYRCKSGERTLGPEQQQWILQLFGRHGYTEGLEFDEYADTYYFEPKH